MQHRRCMAGWLERGCLTSSGIHIVPHAYNFLISDKHLQTAHPFRKLTKQLNI